MKKVANSLVAFNNRFNNSTIGRMPVATSLLFGFLLLSCVWADGLPRASLQNFIGHVQVIPTWSASLRIAEGDALMWKTLILGLGTYLLFSSEAMALCSSYTMLSNGNTADATQVMANFNCAALTQGPTIDSPSLTGNVVITGTSGWPLTVQQAGGAGLKVLATSTGDANLALDRYGSGTSSNNAVNFYTNGTADYQMGEGVAVAGIFTIFDYSLGSFPIAIATSSGYVGINNSSPAYALDVNGTAYATGAAGALSDIRHKTHIATLDDGALQLVMHLRPVTFQWKKPVDDGMRGQQIGFIAQEVEKVIPSVVLTQKNAEKTKGLKYDELIPILTKALQEQEAEISLLKGNNEYLHASNDNQGAEVKQLQRQVSALERNIRIRMAQK